MKNPAPRLRLIFVAFLLAITANFVSAQIRTSGEVVELVDGKTVVVQVPTGRITVELQYIDVPEPAQMLHAVVKEHVSGLLLGKSVELQTRSFTGEKAAGQLMLNGVDVSRQLLRDGAAWHVPVEMSGQAADEFREYAESESLARQEKRGVWSVAGLKPAWEIRAENDDMRREAEAEARRIKPIPVGVGEYHTDTRRRASGSPSSEVSTRSQMDAWVGTFAYARKESYGLQTFNDPNGRYSVVYTSPILIEFTSPAGKEKLEFRAFFVTGTRYDGRQVSVRFVGFRAMSDDFRFSKVNTRMTALADKQVLAFKPAWGGRATGLIGSFSAAAEEIMMFEASKLSINKIANSKSTVFRINKHSGSLSAEGRELFRQIGAIAD